MSTPFRDRPTYGACPKCGELIGGDGWTVRFHETQHDYPWAGGSMFPPTRSEHLDWLCPRCGYAIQTETADAKAAGATLPPPDLALMGTEYHG